MVRDLWWHGIPASVRGQVWRLAVANELNLTSGSHDITLCSAVSNILQCSDADCRMVGEASNPRVILQQFCFTGLD